MVRIGELAPELVVVSGDVFDHPRVTASPIATFAKAVGDLVDRAPGTTVAIAAGLRDTPLDAGRLGPLEVVGALGGVEVATDSVRRFRLEDAGGSVTLAPHAALARAEWGKPVAEPDGRAKWNVLVAYAEADSSRRRTSGVLAPGRWDYVALGSRHVRTQLAEGVHYCGSLERIGPDPWAEAAAEKGFILADLRSGATTFFPMSARAVVSLAPVDAGAGGPAAVARRLSEALAGVRGAWKASWSGCPCAGWGRTTWPRSTTTHWNLCGTAWPVCASMRCRQEAASRTRRAAARTARRNEQTGQDHGVAASSLFRRPNPRPKKTAQGRRRETTQPVRFPICRQTGSEDRLWT